MPLGMILRQDRATGLTWNLPEAIDLMHVAAALILKADLILSFDERQRKAAEIEGMRVGP